MADLKLTPVMVVLSDANDREVQLGPFNQICVALEVVGHGLRAACRQVPSKEMVVYGAGGWWFHNDQAYDKMFIRSAGIEEQ